MYTIVYLTALVPASVSKRDATVEEAVTTLTMRDCA